MYDVGAHVSVAKGLSNALFHIKEMGGTSLQIFSSSPRSFGRPKFTPKDCEDFKLSMKKENMKSVVIHASYLINLGSPDSGLLQASIETLVSDLNFAHSIGALGVVVHTGSHKGKGFNSVVPTVVSSLKEILSQSTGSAKLLLEIASGSNGKIGNSFEELAILLKEGNDDRLGVCLDTAHLFAGGFRFATELESQNFIDHLDTIVGLGAVSCAHINDSKEAFGSYKDRHENIGEGLIPKESFTHLLSHDHFRKIPLILETPGFDDKGPDKENIDRLKKLLP